jgi:hypothetical protein
VRRTFTLGLRGRVTRGYYGTPCGFWPKPGGACDRAGWNYKHAHSVHLYSVGVGLISAIKRSCVPAGRVTTNKQTIRLLCRVWLLMLKLLRRRRFAMDYGNVVAKKDLEWSQGRKSVRIFKARITLGLCPHRRRPRCRLATSYLLPRP